MNPELLERFLAKKAKKLGITVEELKAQNSSTQAKEPSYEPLPQQPEKVEIPSYVFGPVKMEEAKETQPGLLNEQSCEQNELQMQNIVPTTANGHNEIKETPLQNPEIQPAFSHNNEKNKFALIGYPLGHSLSKIIHEAGFKSLGIEAEYDILETPSENLVDRIKFLKTNGYKGFNVTIPLKLPVSLFVDEVDKYADLARAVNTIYIEADKSLKAFNTDVIGFKKAIPSDINLTGKKVGILGTGGAAHAACVALSECGVKEIAFFTRNIPNSIEFMNYVRRKFPSVEFNVYQIENIRNLSEYSMLVNTTPIGMLGKAGDMSPIEPQALQTLNSDAIVYDVIYNPKKTVLIKDAEKLGLRTITGLDMLIYQALTAQELWFGKTPDFKDMKIAALEEL